MSRLLITSITVLLLAGAALSNDTSEAAADHPKEVRPSPAAATVPSTDAGGKAFDTCSAPSAADMTAWSGGASPYQAIGISIGGASQACAQPNLSAAWVSGRAAEGWSFLPLYSGEQAQIGPAVISADLPTATGQGGADAADAISKATALGFTPGAVLYDDMEPYNSATSAPRVLAYLSGWTTALHNAGYRSGVYAAATSGVADLAAQYNVSNYPHPDAIWSAGATSAQDTSDTGMGLAGPAFWPADRRAHQYSTNVTETWGGVQQTINSEAVSLGSTASGAAMAPGQRLEAGQSIASSTMTLTMQSDGNLVAYAKVGGTGPGPAMWSSKTSGNPGAYLVLQWDGNLVLDSAGGTQLWSSTTGGNPKDSLTVQPDGNIVLYRANNSAAWASGTWQAPPTLTAGQSLSPGYWTQGQLTTLLMQADGNLVMYRKRDGAALWSSNTAGNAGAYVTTQADGNLVVYKQGGSSSAGGSLWASNTWQQAH
ncbi:glycoside hydrolase domain-containing protein [Kitasatospora sp. NPDC008050]|uniref:glycoside hydrolase domain-containing protein n=1 Tax=Kitasatospora sp. NPDC008050 TaxID=3364021 RepID=UPI0036F0C9B3